MPVSARITPFLTLAATQIAFAQPPDAPSTIKSPATQPVFAAPVAPPDPALIAPAALQTLTGGPTSVTFVGTDVPVEAAAKALLEAAGLPFSNFRGDGEEKKISVDWQQTPFWIAAAELEKLSGRAFDGRFGDGLALNRFGRRADFGLDGALAAQTPFVTLVANSLTRTSSRTFSFKANAPDATPNRVEPDQVRMAMAAYFDPKLRVQSSVTRALKFQKQGETATIAGREDPFGFFGRQNSGPISEVMVQLPPEATAGTKFSRVSGVLHSVIVAASENFAIPDVMAAKDAAKTLGGTRYALQSARIEGDQLTVVLTTTAIGAAAPGRDFGFYNPGAFSNLKVRDAQGDSLRSGGSSTRGGPNARGELSFGLKNDKGEARTGPFSLEWPIVTQTRSLDLPFELRDVVVP